MNKTNICPKCGQYIFGTYCHTCKADIRSMAYDKTTEDIFKTIFGEDTPYIKDLFKFD